MDRIGIQGYISLKKDAAMSRTFSICLSSSIRYGGIETPGIGISSWDRRNISASKKKAFGKSARIVCSDALGWVKNWSGAEFSCKNPGEFELRCGDPAAFVKAGG